MEIPTSFRVVVQDRDLWDPVLIVSNWGIWLKTARWVQDFQETTMETRGEGLRDLAKRKTDFMVMVLVCYCIDSNYLICFENKFPCVNVKMIERVLPYVYYHSMLNSP